jgi:NTE family protein
MLFRAAEPALLSLALQGGGAHGAFTWGVLDALLEHGLPLDGVSGTSAGAMNAVALAHGLARNERGNDHDAAREALDRFWGAIGAQLPSGLVNASANGEDGAAPSFSPMARAMMMWTQFMSPAQLNPLDRNPLREVLAEQIDFARLRATRGLRLFIAATQANTGRLRLFHRHELTVDTVLASACLPTIHHAIVIDGEPYWDGAYSANPALFPLLFECRARDVLIVLLSTLQHDEAPQTAAAIRERGLEIAFNATFLREVQTLAQALEFSGQRWWPAGRLERVLNRAHFHLISLHEGGAASLPSETKLMAHRPFLEKLRDQGRAVALEWLGRHAGAIGRHSTVDLLSVFGHAGSRPHA